jgi:hypothetical protein
MKRLSVHRGAKYQATWEGHVIRVLLYCFPALHAGNHIRAFYSALPESQG